jgi:hypothetical protein
MEYEAMLTKKLRPEPFKSFKYFQYLALLYTEIFLVLVCEKYDGSTGS